MSDTTLATEDTSVDVTTTPTEPAVAPEPAGRAAPRDLETDLRRVLDDYVTGVFVLDAGKALTPHAIAGRIGALRGGGDKDRPSTGAVSAALNRWAEVGYITISAKPLAFVDYTDAGRSEGLSALKAKFHQNKIAARAAQRNDASATATKAPTSQAPAAEPVDAAPVDGEPQNDAAPF